MINYKYQPEKLERFEQALSRLIDEVSKLSSNPSHIILTNKEVLIQLDISDKTLASYREKGFLGYRKIGNKFFYTLKDILDMLHQFYSAPFNSS